ncbi:MAG: NmrA family NAD(P)-binding protein [Elusimicrobiaceae bacterium]|nr:NmrA family NAD(P)-binding protein [Elusimicrobiaceae bacterium]
MRSVQPYLINKPGFIIIFGKTGQFAVSVVSFFQGQTFRVFLVLRQGRTPAVKSIRNAGGFILFFAIKKASVLKKSAIRRSSCIFFAVKAFKFIFRQV